MRIFSATIAFVLLAALSVPILPAGPAFGEDTAPPETLPVTAVAYRALPPGAAFLTQPQTGSKLDEDAWAKLDAALPRLGFRIAADAPLILSVETQLSDRLGDFGSPFNYEEKSAGVKAGGNLFSTDGGSLLNPGIPAPKSNRVFRVSLSVYDRKSGLYIWRGAIERADSAYDPTRALDFMVPELLKYLGVSTTPTP